MELGNPAFAALVLLMRSSSVLLYLKDTALLSFKDPRGGCKMKSSVHSRQSSEDQLLMMPSAQFCMGQWQHALQAVGRTAARSGTAGAGSWANVFRWENSRISKSQWRLFLFILPRNTLKFIRVQIRSCRLGIMFAFVKVLFPPVLWYQSNSNSSLCWQTLWTAAWLFPRSWTPQMGVFTRLPEGSSSTYSSGFIEFIQKALCHWSLKLF